MLDNKIIIVDNVLSPDECQELIQFFGFEGYDRELRGTKILSIDMDDIWLASKVNKITKSINQFFNTIKPEWCEIVEWEEACFQPIHRDMSSPNTVFTSITYLNDDYQGGHTHFKDDMQVIPKVGRTVFFDGVHYLHGVTPVTSGTRYTLPIWYMQG
jgi:hypothetical protein